MPPDYGPTDDERKIIDIKRRGTQTYWRERQRGSSEADALELALDDAANQRRYIFSTASIR